MVNRFGKVQNVNFDNIECNKLKCTIYNSILLYFVLDS